MKKINYFIIFFIFVIALYFYFPFSAEDSYIVGRYAYNFGTYGELAYNIEEPISALTSPLHAIIGGLLYTGFQYDPVIIWKYFSVLLLVFCSCSFKFVLFQNT